MVIKYFICFIAMFAFSSFNYCSISPDGNGNPGVITICFSWYKRATERSSFYALEKLLE